MSRKGDRQLKVLERCDAALRELRNKRIIALAREQWHKDGQIEVDWGREQISEGDDNGAYVSAWVWVDFRNTDLNKESES